MKEKESEILQFLLPDLLGKARGLTNDKGDMIFPSDFDIPPDSYIFFISTTKWEEYKKGARDVK